MVLIPEPQTSQSKLVPRKIKKEGCMALVYASTAGAGGLFCTLHARSHPSIP